MKTVTRDYLKSIDNLEKIKSEGLTITGTCDKCELIILVHREKDKIGQTIGEVRGLNYHDGLAHYVCSCGEPFDLFIDL